MKTIEWNQSPEGHDKIVIKATLRGGRTAIFQVNRQLAVYLPKFCIMHIGIRENAEEEFFCDFRRLAPISGKTSMPAERRRNDAEPVVIRSRHDDDITGPLRIAYSIRRTEKDDKPWLGINGWQELRHTFELTVSEDAAGSNAEDPVEKKKSFFRPALVVASAGILVAFVVTVPFVLGSLAPDSPNKTVLEKEPLKYAVTVKKEEGAAEGNTADPAVVAEKEDTRHKTANVRQNHKSRRTLRERGHAVGMNKSGDLKVPCSPDMKEKGICE